MNDWKIDRVRSNVHVITFEDIKAGWKQRVLLSGDRQHDHPLTDQALEKRHLDQALEENAPWIDIGDLYDLMQGKYDPRRQKSNIRPEHNVDDYFDAVQEDAFEFYKPYADICAVIGKGNHETSVLRHNEVDVNKVLTRRLRNVTSRPDRAFSGGFGGWVIFRFQRGKGGGRLSLPLKYHHGQGGGNAQVTKGVIQTNRRAVYLPDASIIVTGHIHESWVFPLKRERITIQGRTYQDTAWHVSVPTYKEEYGDGDGGFHIERGRPPKPVGCIWVEFSYSRPTASTYPWIKMDIKQDII